MCDDAGIIIHYLLLFICVPVWQKNNKPLTPVSQVKHQSSTKACMYVCTMYVDRVRFFLWMPQTHPWMLGFFKKRPTFFQNDHCTTRGSQHFD